MEANASHLPTIGLVVGRHHRQWANINSELGLHLVIDYWRQARNCQRLRTTLQPCTSMFTMLAQQENNIVPVPISNLEFMDQCKQVTFELLVTELLMLFNESVSN